MAVESKVEVEVEVEVEGKRETRRWAGAWKAIQTPTTLDKSLLALVEVLVGGRFERDKP